jgi:hypothetical protein
MGLVESWLGEVFVHGVEEMVPDGDQTLSASLSQLDEVIHEHIRDCKRPLKGAVGRSGWRRLRPVDGPGARDTGQAGVGLEFFV